MRNNNNKIIYHDTIRPSKSGSCDKSDYAHTTIQHFITLIIKIMIFHCGLVVQETCKLDLSASASGLELSAAGDVLTVTYGNKVAFYSTDE